MTTPFAGIRACVFDAYGTLFDVASAVHHCRAAVGGATDALAATWRRKQLEYTWLRSLMGRFADFWTVTGEALDYAMAASGNSDPALRARLMERFLRLRAYGDAAASLQALRAKGMRTAILSNGTASMLTSVLNSAGLRPLFDQILSVDAVRVYKPHPDVYRLACDSLAVAPEAILFVSANGWDAAGAAAFGFTTVLLDRGGNPPEHLPASPGARVHSLADIPALVA